MGKLNDKQARFVAEYLVDSNATQAAIRAGYSKKTARNQASDLLAKPDIKAAVAKGQAKVAAKLELSAEKILEDIDRISERAEQEGQYGAALKGRELLGKSLKLFVDKVEHSGQVTLEQLVAGSLPKAETK
jgi:phage terminase small subunit